MAVAYIATTRVVRTGNGVRDRRIVFYHDAENEVTPFIVHMEVFNEDGWMYRHRGSYCRTFVDGWQKFITRAHVLLHEEFNNVHQPLP